MTPEDKKTTPRTPPLSDLGPLLQVDRFILEDRLKRLSPKDRQVLLDKLRQYAVEIIND
jgi:hypothetical protein